jgi:hypothetical protein
MRQFAKITVLVAIDSVGALLATIPSVKLSVANELV